MSASQMMSNPESSSHGRLVTALICLTLILLTIIVFAAVKDNGFINLDDNRYVYQNPHIQSGLNADSLKYAFSIDFSNWHPLTWLSLMLDYQLFHLDPAGYHVVNLIFHVINTLLLFLFLHRMTKALWPCAFVAAMFAVHPLHVESVAWVAERKDVLSGLFWILTMGAYSYYVEKPSLQTYAFVLLFFILGLMSKPMVVTLPFALLLLDYWPLRRIEILQWSRIRPLLMDKIPLFVLTIFACILTFTANQTSGAVESAGDLSLFVRLGNALISYVAYIGKMIYPAALAVLYPHPLSVALWQGLAAALLLAAVTAFVIWKMKEAPYLVTGWLWYLGTLVPVIGIVQAGIQSMADRYTYIPLIGVFIMAAWGAADLAKKWKLPKAALPVIAAGILLILAMITRTQVGYWQNNLTLYSHTLSITRNNFFIHNNRGNVYNSMGNYAKAIEDYDRSIEIKPDFALAYVNRGAAYSTQGNYQEAIEDLTQALKIKPDFGEAYINRGIIYTNMGKYQQAIEDLNRAIEHNPSYAIVYFSRGIAHIALEHAPQAIEDFSRAIDLEPSFAGAYYQRGLIYFNQKNIDAGCRDARKLCEMGNCELLQGAQNEGRCQ